MKKVLIGKSAGSPSTRPVYALTIDQALDFCKKFAEEKSLKTMHPLEKWIREKVMPVAKSIDAEPRAALPAPKTVPIWTPDDIPKAVEPPLPKRIKAVEDPQPRAPDPAPKGEATNLTDYSIWLRYPGQPPREMTGQKWILPAVHWEGQVLWKKRLGIDISDIRRIVEIRDEDAESLKDILWAKNGGQKCLVDNLAWQRIKALPSAKNNPVAIAAFDELFAHETRRQENPPSVEKAPEKAKEPPISAEKAPEKSLPAAAVAPASTVLVAEASKFGFIFNGRHVCSIYAARDEDGCLWVGTRCMEPVFGPLEIWPQALRNSKRRVIHWNNGPITAIGEADIAKLAQALTPSERSSGAFFVRWLDRDVKPTLKSASSMALESKCANFFFRGVTHEVHVAIDSSGEIWSSIPEVENLLDLKASSWPDKARLSQKKIIAYNGGKFPAVSEEYLEDIAASAPPSRRDRAKAFCSWWTKDVWDMCSASQEKAETEAPKPEVAKLERSAGSLAEQARDVANLILQLVNENQALLAENAQLKADLAKMEKAKTLISKQKEIMQAMFSALES